jgi:hypothetical protein
VDFDAKTATVTMKAGQNLSKEACEKAFEGTKYKVAKFEPASG